MKHLIIIGARGWGRETYALAKACRGYGEEFDIKGFLDDKTAALDGMAGYPPILDSVEHYEPQPDDVFTCAMGDAHWKRHYAEIVLRKNGHFISLVHKSAYVGHNTRMGQGCIVCNDVSISCDIEIGDFVTFQRLADVGHDVRIGSYAHLGTKSFMGGYSSIGEESTIQTSGIVLPHVSVGNHCLVGAGAVVIRKVKDGQTVYGNPARVLKY
ncbi:MAG: acetyltransferase [Bacteroidaceae bacterium]|nr:acetyltransferase [Bacteroidaceae bacterium]MBR1427487.1 acetyltransferase [Prevotella sp.]